MFRKRASDDASLMPMYHEHMHYSAPCQNNLKRVYVTDHRSRLMTRTPCRNGNRGTSEDHVIGTWRPTASVKTPASHESLLAF